LEKTDSIRALVMELVAGPTLADRIGQGPIPIDEALPIAKQIAEALEAAHEQGIIHRDLKPANIKLRTDGTVKVLDFGLAKVMEPVGTTSSGLSQSPTITTPAMTQAGIILGTAAYMSPEQARGKGVDKRADIWAFGCVLYEMSTRKRAFGGDNVLDTFAAIVGMEPDWSALPANTPTAIRRLLRRALTKNPKNRLADASMARLEIEDALTRREGEAPDTAVVKAERSRLRERAAWTLVAASLLASAVLSVPAVRYLRGPASVEPVQFLIDAPPARNAFQISVSPDGRYGCLRCSNRGRRAAVRASDRLGHRATAGWDGRCV
jgi:serine/threonine protein kinase